jgi:hypothetical protein
MICASVCLLLPIFFPSASRNPNQFCADPGEQVSEHIIEVVQQRSGRTGVSPLRSTQQYGSGHGRCSALATDVPDQDALAVSRQNAAAVEIAANLADGMKRKSV